jgi:hypothetical protein
MSHSARNASAHIWEVRTRPDLSIGFASSNRASRSPVASPSDFKMCDDIRDEIDWTVARRDENILV